MSNVKDLEDVLIVKSNVILTTFTIHNVHTLLKADTILVMDDSN